MIVLQPRGKYSKPYPPDLVKKYNKQERRLRKSQKVKERRLFDEKHYELYELVKAKYGKRCAGCGVSVIGMHHINGDHSDMRADNLVPLCWPCHMAEHQNINIKRCISSIGDIETGKGQNCSC